MASQPTPPADERQPLLAKPSDEENLAALESAEQSPSPHDTPDSSANAKGKDAEWTRSSVAWYAGLVVAGLVALGLLIKGLIDTGDTDVRNRPSTESIQQPYRPSVRLQKGAQICHWRWP